MSYSLSALQSGQCFHFTGRHWGETLRLAVRCGWQPAGTVMEPDEFNNFRDDWQGGYQSNDYQTVTAADAQALADAVGEAIKSPLLEPDWADYLRQFVTFARASGGFNLG